MYPTFIRIPIVLATFTGLCFIYACSSATWEETQQSGTYEAYQAYIHDNPDGKHVAEARQRADSLYWNSVRNDTTAKAFEKYLDKFPNGQYRAEAQSKLNKLSGIATKARVTGSNVIIRSNHTTESPSAGVVAREGTIVQILDRHTSGGGNEAILKRSLSVRKNGDQIKLTQGKAVHILEDHTDSVRASFTTSNYGTVEAMISKDNIEAMSGEKWYKIRTTDDITGWIYGKFIEEL